MSRTDKTDPMWVRMADPANRWETRECHDHTKGPCDLGTWEPWMGGNWRWRGQKYEPRSCWIGLAPIRRLVCSCSRCSGRAWNNWQGSSRAEWRAQRQAWLAGWGEYRKERGGRKYWYD